MDGGIGVQPLDDLQQLRPASYRPATGDRSSTCRPRRRRGPCCGHRPDWPDRRPAGSSPTRLDALGDGQMRTASSIRRRKPAAKALPSIRFARRALPQSRCPRTHSAIRWASMEGSPDMRSSCCARPPLDDLERGLGQPPGLGEQCTIASFALHPRRAVTATLSRLEGEFQRRPAGTRLCAQAYRHSPGRATQEGRIAGSGDVRGRVSAAEQARDTPTTGCAGRKGRAAG